MDDHANLRGLHAHQYIRSRTFVGVLCCSFRSWQRRFQCLARTRVSPKFSFPSDLLFAIFKTSKDPIFVTNRAVSPTLFSSASWEIATSIRTDTHSRFYGLHSPRSISSRSIAHTEQAEARGVILYHHGKTALTRLATWRRIDVNLHIFEFVRPPQTETEQKKEGEGGRERKKESRDRVAHGPAPRLKLAAAGVNESTDLLRTLLSARFLLHARARELVVSPAPTPKSRHLPWIPLEPLASACLSRFFSSSLFRVGSKSSSRSPAS